MHAFSKNTNSIFELFHNIYSYNSHCLLKLYLVHCCTSLHIIILFIYWRVTRELTHTMELQRCSMWSLFVALYYKCTDTIQRGCIEDTYFGLFFKFIKCDNVKHQIKLPTSIFDLPHCNVNVNLLASSTNFDKNDKRQTLKSPTA